MEPVLLVWCSSDCSHRSFSSPRYPRSAINAPGKSYYVNFAVFVLPLEEVAEICLAIETCMSFDYDYGSQVAWLHRVPPWCAAQADATFLNNTSPGTVFCLRLPEAGGAVVGFRCCC
jgi:hypothetical protein